MGGHLLWAAGIALPCRFELSFVLVQRHTVLSEDVRATTRQNFIQTRGKSQWQQLVTYSNGPRCFVLLRKPLWACYTLRHLFLASFSFCSFQVDAYTCTAQSVRALGVTKRNCSVNSRHNVECWKWSQLMKDLCVRVFVCLNIACLVDICFFNSIWMMNTKHLLFLLLQRQYLQLKLLRWQCLSSLCSRVLLNCWLWPFKSLW